MNWRVRLLAWDRDRKHPASEVAEGVEIQRIHLRSRHGRGTMQIFFYMVLYLQMLWRGWKTRFDVIHCHDLDTLPIGFVLGKLKRKPIVYDAHETFVGMLEGNVNARVLRMLTRLENFILRRVDLLITVGEKLRCHFEARGARHSVVIGNWKNLEEYNRTEQENAQFRAELGIPAHAVLITCITQLLKNRMIVEMIDAVAPYPDVYLLVAGRGALADVIRQRASENARVLFPGFIHASNVATYTCASDVIYCGFDPVNTNEQFAAPNKLYEALAAGKPLIAPDVGEIGELTRRGDCGIVTPDCSVASLRKAVEAVRDPQSRLRWTENARLLGRAEANWNKGREILFKEYRLLSCPKSGG
jgi:glycosyltransferase involved in cell wall biosynthesis